MKQEPATAHGGLQCFQSHELPGNRQREVTSTVYGQISTVRDRVLAKSARS
jgi:hypothetical protein